MSTTIMDGTGNNYRAGVTSTNRLRTQSVTESTYRSAVENARAFNINDFDKSLSATTGEQAVLYVKNNSSTKNIELVNLFGGFWDYTVGTESSFKVKIYQNPEGGTLISDASTLTVQNRSAGATDTFDSDMIVYGASAGGKTFTTVPTTPNAFLIQGAGRLFASIDLQIAPGQAFGIAVDTTGGDSKYYIGFAGYLEVI